jgi:hypothetical protein
MTLLPETPLFTTAQFILASGLFAGSYVGSIYALQSARLGGSGQVKSRDDPEVIKARLSAVSVSTIGSMLGVGVVVWKAGNMSVSFDTNISRIEHPLLETLRSCEMPSARVPSS